MRLLQRFCSSCAVGATLSGFGLLFFASPGAAQSAKVRGEATVRAGAGSGSRVTGTLQPGDAVTVDLRLSGEEIAWCGVTRASEPVVSGFVDCSKLEIEAQPAEPKFRPASADAIDRLLTASGFDLYVRDFTDPRGLETTLSRDQQNSAAVHQIVEVFAQTFRPEGFLTPVRAELERTYSDELADAALAWYQSEIGQRIVAVEKKAVTTASAEEFQQFLRELPNHPPRPARVDLIDRLWRVSDYYDLQLDVATSVTRALAGLLNPRLPPEQRLTEEGLQKITDEVKQWHLLFADISKARFLYVYRNMDDRDLDQYVRFWETPAGQWFRRGMYQGSANAVRELAVDFAERMIEMEERRER